MTPWAVRWEEMAVEKRGTWHKVWLRLDWRVLGGVLLYLLPTFVSVERPEMYRDTGLTIIVAAFASWIASQGRRKPKPQTTARGTPTSE